MLEINKYHHGCYVVLWRSLLAENGATFHLDLKMKKREVLKVNEFYFRFLNDKFLIKKKHVISRL